MAEWFKAAVLKTAVGVSLPWARIPLSPPDHQFPIKINNLDRSGRIAIGTHFGTHNVSHAHPALPCPIPKRHVALSPAHACLAHRRTRQAGHQADPRTRELPVARD